MFNRENKENRLKLYIIERTLYGASIKQNTSFVTNPTKYSVQGRLNRLERKCARQEELLTLLIDKLNYAVILNNSCARIIKKKK